HGAGAFGAYAEYAVSDRRAVVPIPDDMPNGVAAALATQYCTAYHAAYEMVNLYPGDHVLVQAAAGGVGTALVQLAKLKGCTVYGTAGSGNKLDYLTKIGVDHPINYRKQDFAEEVMRIRGGEKLDVVFDSLGGKTFSKGKKLLAHGGRIVGFGIAERSGSKGHRWANLKLAWNFGLIHPIGLLMNSRGVIGVNMLRIADFKPHIIERCLKALTRLEAEGKIAPQVGGVFKASRIAEAHRFLEDRQSTGKVVVEWD
ncbi:MAG: zinc-binding alcohol dehydrogenase family protein, partial [Flavobacteriales bacterium]